jgi:hypothetical protein
VQKLYFCTAASPDRPMQKYSFCTPPERVQFKTVGDGLQSVFANTGIIKDGINIAETFHQQL